VQEWEIDERGLKHDREWMVITDDDHKFLTQREQPKMSLIGVTLKPGGLLTLTAPGMDMFILDPVRVTRNNNNEKYFEDVQIWGQQYKALDMGDDAAAWFSTFLKMEVRLVQTPRDHARTPPTQYITSLQEEGVALAKFTSFADAYPFLLATNTSLNDLNKRLRQKSLPAIELNRFRSNFIVANTERAYEEDEWYAIQIGGKGRQEPLVMYNVKPCTRCTMPNVNPKLGKRDVDVRTTLFEYRHPLAFKDPIFAVNLVHEESCVGKKVRVGDLVKVIRWKEAPEFHPAKLQ